MMSLESQNAVEANGSRHITTKSIMWIQKCATKTQVRATLNIRFWKEVAFHLCSIGDDPGSDKTI